VTLRRFAGVFGSLGGVQALGARKRQYIYFEIIALKEAFGHSCTMTVVAGIMLEGKRNLAFWLY
jgi:hypothetical protein